MMATGGTTAFETKTATDVDAANIRALVAKRPPEGRAIKHCRAR